jgi:hypothetical protein
MMAGWSGKGAGGRHRSLAGHDRQRPDKAQNRMK